MNTIAINVENTAVANEIYNNLKRQYPKFNIIKHDKDFDEMLEDEYLLALAEERLKNGSGITYSREEVMARYGITQEDLDNAEVDEIE